MRLRPRVEQAMSALFPIFLGRLITTDVKLSVNAHLEKLDLEKKRRGDRRRKDLDRDRTQCANDK